MTDYKNNEPHATKELQCLQHQLPWLNLNSLRRQNYIYPETSNSIALNDFVLVSWITGSELTEKLDFAYFKNCCS